MRFLEFHLLVQRRCLLGHPRAHEGLACLVLLLKLGHVLEHLLGVHLVLLAFDREGVLLGSHLLLEVVHICLDIRLALRLLGRQLHVDLLLVHLDVTVPNLLLFLQPLLQVGACATLVCTLHLVYALAQLGVLLIAVVLLLVEHRLPLRVQLRLLGPFLLLLLLRLDFGSCIRSGRRPMILLVGALLGLLALEILFDLLA
mmetsp:Transcript_12587/g.32216  ORF Transcript_12587/g.32216 Transcript_12587/m.32216 type:complete len:200 (-) Transcript_12587:761-1360(-)